MRGCVSVVRGHVWCSQEEAPATATEDWSNEWGQPDLARLLDTYVFWDASNTMGEVVCELGNTYLHTGVSTNAGWYNRGTWSR